MRSAEMGTGEALTNSSESEIKITPEEIARRAKRYMEKANLFPDEQSSRNPETKGGYLEMICRELEMSAKDDNLETNPDAVQLPNFTSEDYRNLASELRKAAEAEGIEIKQTF